MNQNLKILLWFCMFACLEMIPAHAQLLTNKGDTLSIMKGDYIYVNGGVTLQDSGRHFPYIYSNGKVEISGDFIRSAKSVYLGGTDTVILTGRDSQLFPGFSYGVLSIDSGNIKNLSGKAFIRNQLVLNRGFIHTGNDTIQLDSIASMKEDSTDYVTGNMTITRNLKRSIAYTNGNIGLELQAQSATPGMTTIFRKTGPGATQQDFCSNGIARYFDVKPTGSKIIAKMVFHYYPVELNGITKANLDIFQSPNQGLNWTDAGYSSRNATASTVTMNSIQATGRLTLADLFNGLVDPAIARGDTTVCLGQPVVIGGDSSSGHQYSWVSVPAGFVSQSLIDTFKPSQSGIYVLKESVPNKACIHYDTVKVHVNTLPDIGFKMNQLNCSEFAFSANDTSMTGYTWDFGDGTVVQGATALHSFATDSVYTVKLYSTNSSGCTGEHDSSFAYQAPGLDYAVYPNPAFDRASIRFNLCQGAHVSIVVLDELGRDLGTIVDGDLSGGFYEYPIDFRASNWRPAMYFIKTSINSKTLVNKIVRMK